MAAGPEYAPRSRHIRPDGTPIYTNRLILEDSPYLRQHAHNPVDWRPWGDEAFAEARRLGRPLFVSIGYSTCHWCHVMEEESFDDPALAAVLNARFVAVKVDRETRPDVDRIYMAAVQALTGSGGWPLNVFLTPAAEPIYGGTYFPPTDRGQRPGFQRVLETVSQRYQEDPLAVARESAGFTAGLRAELAGPVATASRIPGAEVPAAAARFYAGRLDASWGGLRGRQKFPSSLPVRFLLRHHRRTGADAARHAAVLTLEKMAQGGIRDHIGGGFHRYATDARWLVPHFEKMLYDNALLALAYLEGFQATEDARFRAVAAEILDYVGREMSAPQGAFYSATDADSPGPSGEPEEGYFFSWTPDEVRAALSPADAAAAIAFYGITDAGNHEGRTVLHSWRTLQEVARELGVDREMLSAQLGRARTGLLAARAQRPAPLRDEKILTAWNGLMIQAFARSGFILDEARYIDAAAAAADFVLERMRPAGRLVRVHLAGHSGGPAFLDDYAFLIAGLLDLYEARPDPRWLREAIDLQAALDALHWDPAGGGYFETAADHEALLARAKPAYDGATPSGNSVAALNLLRLAEFTGSPGYLERLGLLLSAFYEPLEENPASLSEMLLALEYQLAPPREIVLVSRPGAGDRAPMLDVIRAVYAPSRILTSAEEGPDLDRHAELVPLLRRKRAIEGRATAYVCRDRVCDQPTADPDRLRAQLRE